MDKKDLIGRGYFPRELPPPFKTTSLANFVRDSASTLPSCPSRTAKLYSHSYARYGSLRRKLSIPNPAFFLEISQVIETNWPDIKAITQQSQFSKSKPIHTPLPKRNRSISPLLEFSDLPAERAKNRTAGRYILQADISQFYHSIYTHSIPWAIHGKNIAKKQRNNMLLFGNKLDQLFRNSQDGQTLGIPIGPDSSLVIAELILCASDIKLEERIKSGGISNFKGFRYSDDYEFAFISRSEAEAVLSYIQQILSEFELTLNTEKTKIIELPSSLDAFWVLELSNYKFDSHKKSIQMQDIIRYFDKAFKISIENPQEPVLKYAIARLSNFDKLHQDNWPLVESLLLQSITIDPSTLRDALAIIHSKYKKQQPVDLEALEENINLQILRHAPLGHSSEVAWAIWSIIVFNLSISKEAAQSISQLEDSVVALLALDAHKRGRIKKDDLSTKQWESFLTGDELYGNQWLLSYEANFQGDLCGKTDYVSEDVWFSHLKKNGVTFYDRSAPLLIPPNENSGPSGEIQSLSIEDR